jgi:hypothetical protein
MWRRVSSLMAPDFSNDSKGFIFKAHSVFKAEGMTYLRNVAN